MPDEVKLSVRFENLLTSPAHTLYTSGYTLHSSQIVSLVINLLPLAIPLTFIGGLHVTQVSLIITQVKNKIAYHLIN